jgi:F-type H+-transporting ATPase subunit delta
MTLNGIAARYALALVDAVASPKAGIAPDRALSQLKDFADLVQSMRELRLVLQSPSVSPHRKSAVISRIADAMQMHRLIKNFLLVLNDHRRMNLIKEVSALAFEVLDEKLGFVRARVESAAPLSDEESRQVQTRLEQVTGSRVRMDARVVPDLIGGVIARVGSTVYDGSVRGRLQALEEHLVTGA